MHKPLGWVVRERRDSDGSLLDCFVEAPAENGMAYGLEVLGDDYNGFGDEERKLEHCRMIVEWANAAQHPTSAPDSSVERDAFEAWYQTQKGLNKLPTRRENGYWSHDADLSWDAWQAAIAAKEQP